VDDAVGEVSIHVEIFTHPNTGEHKVTVKGKGKDHVILFLEAESGSQLDTGSNSFTENKTLQVHIVDFSELMIRGDAHRSTFLSWSNARPASAFLRKILINMRANMLICNQIRRISLFNVFHFLFLVSSEVEMKRFSGMFFFVVFLGFYKKRSGFK